MAEDEKSVREFAERRAFVRESFLFKLKFQRLSKADYPKRRADWADQRSSNRKALKREDLDADVYPGAQALDPLPLDLLLQMDDKLDQLIAHVTGKKKIEVMAEEAEGIDLGGGGMRIRAESPLTVGELIEGDLLLSRFPFVRVHFFGEVVEAWLTYREEKACWEVEVRFLNLDSEDRERIIACVFQRQREVLRRRKGIEWTDEEQVQQGL